MTTLLTGNFGKMLSTMLQHLAGTSVSFFFREGSEAAEGRFTIVRTTVDHIIVAIPKADIDQVLTQHANLNRL